MPTVEANLKLTNQTDNDTSPCYSKMETVDQVLLPIHMTIATVVICFNIPTLIVILKYKRLYTVANVFVFSLSCSDLLNALRMPVCLVLNFTSVIREDSHRRVACLICTACAAISLWTSLLNMLFIAVDRYLAVFFCLKYYTKMDLTKSLIVVSCIWVYMMTFSLVFIVGFGVWTSPRYCSMIQVLPTGIYIGFYMMHTIIIFLITLSLHVRVFSQAKRQAIAIENMIVECDRNRGRKEAKVTKAMALVLGVGLSCWTPYTIVNAIRSVIHNAPFWFNVLYKCTFVILYTNGFLNTIVYARKNRDIRTAYKLLFGIKSDVTTDDERRS